MTGHASRIASLYAAVAFGSVIGSVLRALASIAIHDAVGYGFPWGTLFVNVAGSFVIGAYAALTGPGGRLRAGPLQMQLVMTGFCGGFTTFSMFSLETLRLWQNGHTADAGANIALSVVTWLTAVWAGHRAATAIHRRKGT
jgi:CrcB protein